MHGSLTLRRALTMQDLPWALHLAYERYPPFDPGAAVAFYVNAMKSPAAYKARSANAFLIGQIMAPPWRPTERQFHVLVLCSGQGHHWEAVGLLRESADWAHLQKCGRWWFASDTDSKVGALCKRIGATCQERYGIFL